MNPLTKKQITFNKMFKKLLEYADSLGYEWIIGWSFRPKEQAAIYEKEGVGISNSLHSICLAIDLELFVDGEYVTDCTGHDKLGAYWKSLGGSWGGDFKSKDCNHYSLEHNGVR